MLVVVTWSVPPCRRRKERAVGFVPVYSRRCSRPPAPVLTPVGFESALHGQWCCPCVRAVISHTPVAAGGCPHARRWGQPSLLCYRGACGLLRRVRSPGLASCVRRAGAALGPACRRLPPGHSAPLLTGMEQADAGHMSACFR